MLAGEVGYRVTQRRRLPLSTTCSQSTGLGSLIENIPRDRLLTESDAPFRGASSVAARDVDLRKTLSGLTKIYGLKTLNLALTSKQNAESVLIGEVGARSGTNA